MRTLGQKSRLGLSEIKNSHTKSACFSHSIHRPTHTLNRCSDKYWSAVLLEDKNGHRHICGYKSGSFKESETHYHSTFKEILAVKYGIQKFEFHLAAYHFTIVMDCSSFPNMLQFKRKMLPHPQLLR